tara:strand:- start:326 stop:622 length:297 start_codon:yes stop_codon:yes gene_type:complete
MNNNNIPVLGFGSQRIIGHWDEKNNQFIALNKEIIREEISLFMKGNDIYPFSIRITDDVHGEDDVNFLTYRSIGSKKEDPRVIVYITQNENKKLIQEK